MKRLCIFIAAALVAASAFGAGSSVGATRSWTSNYVASVVAGIGESASVSNLVRDVVAEMLNSSVSAMGSYDDDLTGTTNGTAVIYVAVSYHGSYVLERREYDISVLQTNTPPCFGCRVETSAVTNIPVGTLYAVTADGLHLCNVAAALSDFEIYSESGAWRIYGKGGGGTTYDSVYLYDSAGSIRVGKWVGETLVGTFTVQPYALTEEEAAACLGGEPSGYNDWAALAPGRTSSVEITFSTPLDADESSGTQGGVYFTLSYVGPALIDYEEFWPTDEEHYWSPRYGLPPGAWEEPRNWVTFPLTATITYDDDGTTRTRTMSITSLEMLRRLLDKVGDTLVIPPPGQNYVYPVIKKLSSFECAKFGHVWKQCVCTVCGATRDHDFQFESENDCARCQNKDTERERADDGEWKVTETETRCRQYDTEGVLDYHTGWHHVPDPEVADDGWEEFYCTCTCGCFSREKIPLAHDLLEADQPPEQYDETSHKVYSKCSRCLHCAYKLEDHTPDFDDENTELEFRDSEHHYIVALCTKCGAEVRGLRGHNWGYYGSTVDTFCCCPCFFTVDGGFIVGDGGYPLFHTTPVYRAMINPYDPANREACEGEAICERCGDKQYASMEFPPSHYFGYPTSGRPDGVGNETFHYCGCGSQTENHSPEYFDPDIGVCGPCGKSRDKGRGGLPGNDSKTTTDPSSSDPMPPPSGPNDPNNPNDPFSPRNPRSPNPDNPDNPDNPTPPDPPFPQLPDLPSNPNGGNSSTTIDPNVHINNWVRVEFQL